MAKEFVSVKILQRHPSHKNPPGSVCKMDAAVAKTLEENGFVDPHPDAVETPTDIAVQDVAGVDNPEEPKAKKGK